MVVFVVKWYAVREAKTWRYAVRNAKIERYAVRKGGGGCHPLLFLNTPLYISFTCRKPMMMTALELQLYKNSWVYNMVKKRHIIWMAVIKKQSPVNKYIMSNVLSMCLIEIKITKTLLTNRNLCLRWKSDI